MALSGSRSLLPAEAERLAVDLLTGGALSGVAVQTLASLLLLDTAHALGCTRWVVLRTDGSSWCGNNDRGEEVNAEGGAAKDIEVETQGAANIGSGADNVAAAAVVLDSRDEVTSFFAPPELCKSLVARLSFPEIPPHEQHGVPFSFLFGAIPDGVGTAVRACLDASDQHPVISDAPYQLWWVADIEERPSPVLEDGTRLRAARLTCGDAATINDHWEHASSHSLDTVLECVQHRPSIGIHRPVEGAAGTSGVWELIAWAVVRADWSIGMVNVLEPFRGMGLAKYLVSQLAAEVLACKREVVTRHPSYPPRATSYIHSTNIASQRLFTSLGFAFSGESARWMRA